MKKVILCIINVLHHHLCPNHSVHTEVDLGPASMLYLTFPHMVRNHQYGHPYLNLSQKKLFFLTISRHLHLFGNIYWLMNSGRRGAGD